MGAGRTGSGPGLREIWQQMNQSWQVQEWKTLHSWLLVVQREWQVRAFSPRLNPGGGREGQADLQVATNSKALPRVLWLPWNGGVSSTASLGCLDLSVQGRFDTT